MKIMKFMFQASKLTYPDGRLRGHVTMPRGARTVYVGTLPPRGELVIYAEINDKSLIQDDVVREFVVLQENDKIPADHELVGHILAMPLLFVYEHMLKKLDS